MTRITVYAGREKEYKHEWYMKNRERTSLKDKLYYRQNAEAIKEYAKKYYYENFERDRPRRLAYSKEHYPEHNKWAKLRRLRLDVKEKDRAYRMTRKDKDHQYKKDYAKGMIITPKILLIEKSLPLIKELYFGRRWDAKSISSKLSCTKDVIIAVLRKNNLPVKQKQFSPKRYLFCSNGLLVRSNPERIIIEYLIENNVEFIYERPIPYKETTYYPDFYLPEKDLYVEYAGLTDKGWYNKQLEKKKQSYQELNINATFITRPEQIVEVLAL
jgi:hypothetical protein